MSEQKHPTPLPDTDTFYRAASGSLEARQQLVQVFREMQAQIDALRKRVAQLERQSRPHDVFAERGDE